MFLESTLQRKEDFELINLHVHSCFSLRDSIIKPDDLITRLKEIGQDTVAITDHGSSLGGVYIYKKLKEAGLRYIHGCEIYVCDDVKIKDKDSKYHHLVVLCLNDTGRKNLNILISKSEHPDNKYYKPRVDFSMLTEYSEGLLISSACMAGEVSRALENDDLNKAKQIVEKYKSVFHDNYYLEVQSHVEAQQIELNKKIYQLSLDTETPCIVTTDAHYAWESDKDYQNKYAFNGAYKEDGEAYIDCFLQSEQEVRERISYFSNDVIDSLIRNTHLIAEKCDVEMPLSAPIMPHVDTPLEYNSNLEWLQAICEDGFKTKLNIDLKNKCLSDPSKKLHRDVYNEDGEYVETIEFQLRNEQINQYIKRYEYEVDSLCRMGFLDYILLVYSYANVAKRRGIARGSGGGSLVCYVSNITNIDPIEYGLYFERFIDVGALALLESGEITAKELKIPDIDLDFSGDSCREVLKYLFNKYGEENVASIGRFGTNLTKGTIRDMCKVFDIDLKTEDIIAKAFESYEISELDTLIETGEKIPESAKDAVRYINQYPELFRYVRKLTGLPKSFGLHPCGRVISTRPLDEFLPSCYDKDGVRYLQGDMHDVEDVGLVKVDVLGLRTLDQEYDTLEMSGNDQEYINPKAQSYSDPKVLDIFRKGDTVGIFQMSSFGMRQTLKKMDVRGIEDLSVANALYRPGAMAYIDNFCNRRKGKEPFEYLHPDLEPILKNTYGIIVFQEQLIEIGKLAGIHNPDLLRKATGKKDIKLLNQVKPELEEKLYARGWCQEQFDTLWADMIEFSKYSFNKCISGNTKLKRLGQKQSGFHPTIAEMYRIKNDVEYARNSGHYALHQKYKHQGYGNALSMYPDGYIRTNKIVDIYFSGIQQTYKITTCSGKQISCTENHKFPTPNGYKKVSEMIVGDSLFVSGERKQIFNTYNFTDGNFKSNLPQKGQLGFQNINDGESVLFHAKRENCVHSSLSCEICNKHYNRQERFELHHKDNDRTNNEDENLQWLCVSCHKKEHYKLGRTKVFENGLHTQAEKIIKIEKDDLEPVYDIEMDDPAHTFVTTDGIVSSNSHSSAYAIIAYMTAKQKAYYPAEYFAGLCNSYLGESSFVKDNADEIIQDMAKHKVKFKPFSFRNDHRRCSVENGRVQYAIPLIRDCNDGVANALYQARENNYTHFWRLLKDVYDLGAQKSQVSILIKLGFFLEFGNAKQLLRVFDLFESFKQGNSKEIKKDKLEEGSAMYNIISSHSTDIGANKNILKSFKIKDMESILDESEQYILSLPITDFDYRNKIENQKQYLGFVALTTGKEEDRPKLYVKKTFPIHRKKDGALCGYNVVAQSIGSGIETRYTVWNRVFNKKPINEGDIIRCTQRPIKDGQNFTLEKYEIVYI